MKRHRPLGIDRDITRRDFLGSTLLGSGAALLSATAPGCQRRAPENKSFFDPGALPGMEVPDWGSYGGVGDYADAYGNTEAVIRASHAVRRGEFHELKGADDTGELYDLVIVGAGFAGLSAALEFHRKAPRNQRCLILDNHTMFGGEARRNEFDVDGTRLMGPQGSNGTVVVDADPIGELHEVLGIPTEFEHAAWDPANGSLEFARDNYGFMLWGDNSDSIGYYFDQASHGVDAHWARNVWWRGMDGAGWSEKVRADFLAWRSNNKRPYKGDESESGLERWLDSMTYQHYLEQVLGHRPELAEFLNPIVASGLGLGCDAISAYRAYASGVPGFDGLTRAERYTYMPAEPPGLETMPWFSFPGGNTGIARYFVKYLIPEAIPGEPTLENVITGSVDRAALDRPGQRVRMRLASTVVHVSPSSASESGEVTIGYTQAGKTHAVRARSVVMASGSWMNRNIVRGAPDELQQAWSKLDYASILTVNVALTNWRFLKELGITACHWSGGLGFSGNIRRPMHMGDYRPPLDPDQPTVFTMYVSFSKPGLPAKEQGQLSRLELLNTSFADYERQIREQMVRLFGAAGFDPGRDVAGIVLNRWGHAYVVPGPGYHFGTRDAPTAADTIRQGLGRIRFGHSELQGHQNWPGAVIEGRRAAREALERIA